jgi:pimeloyl-ACP methyl ester carboxylesterase
MANDAPHAHRFYLASVALLTLIACVPLLRASDGLSPGEHFATVNGVRLWYRVAGHGPVLIIQAPGWGPASPLLQRYLAPLERSFTMVYYDPRGSGKSSRPTQESKMSTLDMADDLEGFRSYLGLDKIAVLGHSHGAQIAAIFAAKHPDHVSRLILACGGIPKRDTPDFDAELQGTYDRLSKDPRYADAAKAMREPPPQTEEEFGKWFDRTAPFYWHDVSNAKALASLPDFDTWANTANSKADNQVSFDLTADLKKLSAPALIIGGKDDLTISHSELEALKTIIQHSRLVILENTGHFPMIEVPDSFTSVVTDFLRK